MFASSAFQADLGHAAREPERGDFDAPAIQEQAGADSFASGAAALAEGSTREAYDHLSQVPAGHEKYDTTQVLLRKVNAALAAAPSADALTDAEQVEAETTSEAPAERAKRTKRAPWGKRIEWQVAMDAVKQYEMVERHGTAIDRCVHAGFVAAAFLGAQAEDRYQEWKNIERQDCAAAGVPR